MSFCFECEPDIIDYLGVSPKKFNEIFESVKDVGEAFELYQKSSYIAEGLRQKLDAIPNRGYLKCKRYVLWTIPKTNSFTVEEKSWPIQMVHPRELKPNPLNAQLYETKEDRDFEASVKDNGVLEPLVATEAKTVISGHRRLNAAIACGLARVPVIFRDFKDERLALIELNRQRLKTAKELFNEAQLLKEILKPQAEAHQKAGDLLPNLAKPLDVREETAKKLGISHGTLDKIEAIYTHEDKIPQIAREVTEGKRSVHSAYEAAKRLMVSCASCGCATFEPHKLRNGLEVCVVCEEQIKAGKKPLPKPQKRAVEKPKVLQPPKSVETWQHRVAQMKPKVSKMEERIALALNEKGVAFEQQKEFCVTRTVPDFYFPKANLACYLDGSYVHRNSGDKDERLRELLRKRHAVKVLTIPYNGNSQAECDRILKLIMEATQ